MKIDRYDQMILEESDMIDQIMKDPGWRPGPALIDQDLGLSAMPDWASDLEIYQDPGVTVGEFDLQYQHNWLMPPHYQTLDVAQHVLDLCDTQEQLQRCGQELLMYQERGMLPMLAYVIYLVDVMRDNGIIWGVGRGSSVASYVLYKLGLHRIDSMYYDLDPADFLR